MDMDMDEWLAVYLVELETPLLRHCVGCWLVVVLCWLIMR